MRCNADARPRVSSIRSAAKFIAITAVATMLAGAAQAQFVQQGNKLSGTNSSANAQQGSSIAISADGNTMVVGGPGDNGTFGSAWIFVRSSGVWTQQGPKLFGNDVVSAPQQGLSVAISGDGNTVAVGGFKDNFNAGAVRIFTRNGTTWSQQGSRLAGTGNTGNAGQGRGVALSSDGNTLIIGGPLDNTDIGAAWIFTRTNNVWTQQGAKLVGSGVVGGTGFFGGAVALSADGNTALIGGSGDNGAVGAFWIFTRSGGLWSQLGLKHTPTGASGLSGFGSAVSLSGDGKTAMIGGNLDNANVGAAWVFTLGANGFWTQQGNKLVPNDLVGTAQFARSVSLSPDGNTAVIGGSGDNGAKGAAWLFTRSGAVWSQQGTKFVGTGAVGNALQGTSVALSADTNTFVVAGATDNGGQGAAWPYARRILSVSSSANIAATGPVGGPFSPPSFDYTLTALNADVTYAINGVPNWLTATASNGTLTAFTGLTVNLRVNGNATALPAGSYGPATISFADTGGGGATTSITAALTVGATGAVEVVSAVLPASRSVQVGGLATAFATIINTSAGAGTNCGLSLGSTVPASFHFQTTNPATNAVTGTLNAPVAIPPNGVQTYVFSIGPSGPFNPIDIPVIAGCSNGTAATTVVGLNTLLLSASATPVPDIVALAATAGNDGIVNVPGASGTGAFAVATVNVGAASGITASADTGGPALPVAVSLCQTDPASGQCTSAVGPTATTAIAANDTPTFAIFVQGSGDIPFDPAHNRIFVRFKDAGGVVRGATSVAVRTQ